jgi:hypothetical protein
MVRVGRVRMLVLQRLVPVQMRVRLDHRALVGVRMVRVVRVRVRVLERLVAMPMAVARAEQACQSDRISGRGTWLRVA